MERIPKLSKCCCCTSLKLGTQIIGWMQIVGGTLSVLGHLSNSMAAHQSSNYAVGGLILQSLASILLGTLLIVGVNKKMKGLIKAWIIIETVLLVLTVIAGTLVIILAIAFSISQTDESTGSTAGLLTTFAIMFAAVISIGCTIGIYLILVVLSYYREEFSKYSPQADTEASRQQYPHPPQPDAKVFNPQYPYPIQPGTEGFNQAYAYTPTMDKSYPPA